MASSLKKEIMEVYKKYNFRASPVLDQSFLIDVGTIARLVKYADLQESDKVLEIGVGLGFITDEILKYSEVTGIEKDKRLTEYLYDKYFENPKANILIDNFLTMEGLEFNKIVSNIPYSKSSEILFKLTEYNFDTAVLLFQKEFGEKMIKEPGMQSCSRLSIMSQYYFNIEKLEIVPRERFFPSPHVDSVVLRLTKKPVSKNKKFEKFIQQSFRYKNKTARNAVKTAFNKEISEERKLYELTLPELIELSDKVM